MKRRRNATAVFTLLHILLWPLTLSHSELSTADSHERRKRCGFQNASEADRKASDGKLAQYKESIGKKRLQELKDTTITIDVYFHVMTNSDGDGQVTNEQILKQIDVLNDAFEGSEPMYSECAEFPFNYGDSHRTPFHFNLVNLVRIESDAAFSLDSTASRRLQAELRKGTCADLNVFTGDYEFLGEASLPQFCPENGVDFESPADFDNVLISYLTLPLSELSDFTGLYDEGDTLVHEVGHFLGLEHTFEGGCEGGGDFVNDTPPEDRPAFACPLGRDTCSGGGPDPIHNYMNYVDDCCMYQFTEGQTERMILQATFYRGLDEIDEEWDDDDFHHIDDWDDMNDLEYSQIDDEDIINVFDDEDFEDDLFNDEDLDNNDIGCRYGENFYKEMKSSLRRFIRGTT